MKLHIGADTRGGVHRVSGTNAATAAMTRLGDLLHGEERTIDGDQAYGQEAARQEFEASGVR